MTPYQANISNQAYHEHEAVGSSSLKHVLRSPAHYYYNKMNPTPPTPAMQFGTLAHAAILEADRYRGTRAIQPEFSGKGCREAKANWLRENEGRMVITQDQSDTIEAMLKAVDAHRIARSLLHGGVAEQSFFTQDFESGINVKARPDYLREKRCIIDVKTTHCADPKSFGKIAANLLYHLSAAHYLSVVSEVTGDNYDKFILLAIEHTEPFGIGIFWLDEEAVELGRKLRRKALQLLSECKASGRYPGYSENVFKLALPRWSYLED